MGFDTFRFVDKANLDDFKCSICLEVLKKPVMVRECEHVYCHKCFDDWLQKDTSCPQDRVPIEEGDICDPGRFFRNQYGKLKIKCDLADVNWILKLFLIF